MGTKSHPGTLNVLIAKVNLAIGDAFAGQRPLLEEIRADLGRLADVLGSPRPEKEAAAIDLLRRLRQWDMFNPPRGEVCEDAPYWVREIDKVLTASAEVVVPGAVVDGAVTIVPAYEGHSHVVGVDGALACGCKPCECGCGILGPDGRMEVIHQDDFRGERG